MAEGGPAYLVARLTRSASHFYPELHPVVEARLERTLKHLWDALEGLSEVFGGAPVGFALETPKALLSGYSGPEGLVVIASPKKWSVPEGREGAAETVQA